MIKLTTSHNKKPFNIDPDAIVGIEETDAGSLVYFNGTAVAVAESRPDIYNAMEGFANEPVSIEHLEKTPEPQPVPHTVHPGPIPT